MGIRKYNPTSAGRRGASVSDFAELTPGAVPEKGLLVRKKRKGGRNNQGIVTARHRGGGHKRMYRLIDFRRDKDSIPARVNSIQYDPNRSARVALLHYADGEKRYILAPQGLKAGDELQSGEECAARRRQLPAAAKNPARHDDPQHRNAAGQGRRAVPFGRRRRDVDRTRGRLGPDHAPER